MPRSRSEKRQLKSLKRRIEKLRTLQAKRAKRVTIPGEYRGGHLVTSSGHARRHAR